MIKMNKAKPSTMPVPNGSGWNVIAGFLPRLRW